MSRRKKLIGQASVGWGAIDQGLSSATNFALMLITVKSVSVQDFGTFSLVYLVYIMVLPIARSTGTMPYTIRQAKAHSAHVAEATTASVRYAFALGLVAGGVCLGLAAVASPSARAPFAVLGLCFPLLLVQDAVRGVLFFRSEFLRATVNDGVWAVIMLIVIVPIVVTGADASAVFFLGAWGVGGAVAGIFGLFQLTLRLKLVSPLRWLREYADLARPLFLNIVFTILPAQLTYLLMPAVSSVTELGTVRAAYVLFGVLNVVYTTASMVSLPYASRLEPARQRRFAAWLSGAMALISFLWGVLIMLLPAAIGRGIIGPAWDTTGSVRMILAVSLVAEGITIGPTTALAALQMPERMARVRYVTAPLTLVVGLALAARWGANGVALGFAIGYSVTSVMAWMTMPRTAWLSTYRPPVPADGE